MESAGPVYPLVCVRAEKVALPLDKRRGQAAGAQPVILCE